MATLVSPRVIPTTASRTASGSVAVAGHQARVARISRILVEGIHDALLVERVWGDDLRVEGVVVERLEGIDHLAAEIAAFRPAPGRRLGVLVDHLVPGTKESRLAAEVAYPHVLVTGTPFVDVWQAVRPAAVGLTHWPTVPKGQDWKTGICRALGEPDPATCWRRIFASVHSYIDLEPALVGAVERLIDFVTEPLSAGPFDPLSLLQLVRIRTLLYAGKPNWRIPGLDRRQMRCGTPLKSEEPLYNGCRPNGVKPDRAPRDSNPKPAD